MRGPVRVSICARRPRAYNIPMIQETQIESRRDRESHRYELARGIVSAGMLAIAYCGVLTLLRRKKEILLRPIIAFVFLLLLLALMGYCLKADRSSRPD